MGKIVIVWEHVYGHTGEHDNELADKAADLGTKDRISEQSRRWAAPPPPIAGAPEVKMDKCRKCEGKFPEDEIKWHFRRCEVEGEWVIPKDMSQCRICEEIMLYNYRSIHEAYCKGSELANRRCGKCGAVYGDHRIMRCHEKKCKGDKKKEPSGGGEADGVPRLGERAKAKAKVRATARAKAAAKGKGGLKGKGKGKEKGRGAKARGRGRGVRKKQAKRR